MDPDDDVLLFTVRPADLRADAALECLDDGERAGLARLATASLRLEQLATRALVRHVLADVLGTTPGALRFDRQPGGKPVLAGRADVHFNVSNSPTLVACVVAGRDVGVDVEPFSRHADLTAMAEDVFHPLELARLGQLSSAVRGHEAVRVWTLKEAYAKARGLGLALTPTSFAVVFDGNGEPRLASEPSDAASSEERHWLGLHEIDEHALAVCVAAGATPPRVVPRLLGAGPPWW